MKGPRLLSILLLAATSSLWAADYTIDPVHSQAGFKISHLVGKVRGQFKDYQAQFSYDPAKPETCKVEAAIQTKSIDTGIEKRDNHLRSPDFFNVEKFPAMTYKSTSVKRAGPNTLQVDGTLTLLGVSKPVSLAVVESGIAKDPWGGARAGFVATAKINRKDFGMNWNQVLDTGGVLVGNDVDINLEIEAIQKK